MNEFISKIAEILEVESVTEFDVLGDFQEWDSLSVLSVIAMLDSDYRINLNAEDLKETITIGELWQIVQAKKKS